MKSFDEGGGRGGWWGFSAGVFLLETVMGGGVCVRGKTYRAAGAAAAGAVAGAGAGGAVAGVLLVCLMFVVGGWMGVCVDWILWIE